MFSDCKHNVFRESSIRTSLESYKFFYLMFWLLACCNCCFIQLETRFFFMRFVLVNKSLVKPFVVIDATITQEWPPTPHSLGSLKIDIDNGLFFIDA